MPNAERLNAASALAAIGRQLQQETSEARQMREFVAAGGSLIGLVQKHCEIWAA